MQYCVFSFFFFEFFESKPYNQSILRNAIMGPTYVADFLGRVCQYPKSPLYTTCHRCSIVPGYLRKALGSCPHSATCFL